MKRCHTIRQPHLRPDQDDLAVIEDDAAVVAHIAVPHGHAHINQNVLAVRVVDDAGQHLPRVQERVALEEVVEAAIAGDLELGTDAQGRAGLFGAADTLDDAGSVAFEVKGPLVEGAFCFCRVVSTDVVSLSTNAGHKVGSFTRWRG